MRTAFSNTAVLALCFFSVFSYGQSSTWVVNGNTVASDARIGTNNGYDVIVETNNQEQLRVTDAGNLGLGTSVPESKLHLVGDFNLDGKLYFKDWADNQSTDLNLVIVTPTGEAKRLNMPDLLHMLYGVDCVSMDGNYSLPTWNSGSNETSSWMFTGVGCNASVGIGTNQPLSTLDVRGDGRLRKLAIGDELSTNDQLMSNAKLGLNLFAHGGDGMILKYGGDFDGAFFRITQNEWDPFKDVMRVRFDGGMDLCYSGTSSGIAWAMRTTTDDPAVHSDLAVLTGDGQWYCQGLHIKFAPFWSDYVFEPDYKLMSLKDLEQYIQTNKHLPGLPSAKEVAEKGADVYDMLRLLTEKVEELTLYTIEQQKEIEALQAQLKKN